MKNLIRIEETAFLGTAVFLFGFARYDWKFFPILLFLPYLSMLGYLINKTYGSVLNNEVHHRAVSIIIFIKGYSFQSTSIKLLGIILFAHSSLDRIFEFGLKFTDDYKYT